MAADLAPRPDDDLSAAPARVADRRLPEAGVLLGTDAAGVLATAVAAAGGRLRQWRREQVLYAPGQSLAVRFAVEVAWPAGSGPSGDAHGGTTAWDEIVAVVDAAGPPPGTLVLASHRLRVGLFRWPHDPLLPGLRTVTRPAEAARWCGLPDGTEVRLSVRTYRPGRRAVVRVRLRGGRTAADGATDTYLKVVPPAELGGLRERHEVLSRSLPVPRVVACDPDLGLVVLPGLPGQTLRAAHRAVSHAEVDASEVPPAHEVLGLLDRLPATGPEPTADVPARSEDVDFHARLLERVVPVARRRLVALVRATAGPGAGRRVTVHGDFHDAQVMVARGRVTGLLDVDGSGRGTREDDLGTLFAHLSVRALGGGGRTSADWLAACVAALPPDVDRAELKRQAAAAVVGLATGPFRVQSPHWQGDTLARVELAERWVAADEASLSPL
jgi:hypothetical protein